MTSRTWRYAIELLAVALLSKTLGLAQIPGFSINLNRTNFETGVARPLPESFATATVGCRFDDWEKTVNWGDGSNTEKLTHTVQATLPGPSTPAGTHEIFSAHSYSKAGTYSAMAELRVHCFGSSGGLTRTDVKSFTITVFDRLPLRLLTPSSVKVKRGGTLDLTVETFADAPESDTRVDFTASKPNVFGQGTLSMHSDVPAKSITTRLSLKVLADAPLGQVTIRAAAGSQLETSIEITGN